MIFVILMLIASPFIFIFVSYAIDEYHYEKFRKGSGATWNPPERMKPVAYMDWNESLELRVVHKKKNN